MARKGITTLFTTAMLLLSFSATAHHGGNHGGGSFPPAAYVGNANYDLSDSKLVQNAKALVNAAQGQESTAKSAYDTKKEIVTQKEKVLGQKEKALQGALEELATANKFVQTARAGLVKLQTILKGKICKPGDQVCLAEKKALALKVQKAKQGVQAAEASVLTASNKVTQSQNAKNQAQTQVTQAKQAAVPAKKKWETTKKKVQDANQNLFQVRKNVLERIMIANTAGSREGQSDGRLDGQGLAHRLGQEYGSTHGAEAGYLAGEQAGNEREYNDGYQQGSTAGDAQAVTDGQLNGSEDGRVAGNIAAATRNGQRDGEQDAYASDAAIVGKGQGETDGYNLAVSNGQTAGYKLGQEQAINEEESKSLKPVSVNGNYAGSFSHPLPTMPHQFKGPNFDLFFVPGKGLAREAYMDGYKFSYRVASRRAYDFNIQKEYDFFYGQAYQLNYGTAFSVFYQASFDLGSTNGYDDKYSAVYPGYYDSSFNSAKAFFTNNPELSAPEYTSTYARVKKETYDRVYEEIRLAAYNSAKTSTYNANIAEQTEKFRKIKKAEVHGIYQNNAVLDYVSQEIVDAGTNLIAANDGVYMPGEKVDTTVTIKNFGHKAATNVEVQTNDGKVIKLPTLEANSKTTLVGIARNTVNASEGNSSNVTTIVKAPGTAEDSIVKRHFYSKSSNQLNNSTEKKVRAQYPLKVTGLKTTKSLVLNTENSLSASISSIANRELLGPMNVEVIASNPEYVAEPVADISSIGKSKSLKGGKIVVSDEEDAYTYTKFKVEISKNGVLLGYSNSFSTMVRAKFKYKSGTPVVFVNSENSTNKLKDLIDDFGSVKKLSVLDSSLSENSSKVSEGVKGVNVIVIDNGTGSTFKRFESAMKRLSGRLILIYDDNGASDRLKKLSSWRSHNDLPFKVTGVGSKLWFYFSNPILDKSHSSSLSAMRVNSSNVKAALNYANVFSKSDSSILLSLAGLNGPSFFSKTTSKAQLMEVTLIRMIKESLRYSEAYNKTGNSGYISSLTSKSMLQNKINAAVAGKGQKLGLYVAAYDLFYSMKTALQNYDPVDELFQNKFENAIIGGAFKDGEIEDMKDADDYIKDYGGKNLQKLAKANEAYYRPF